MQGVFFSFYDWNTGPVDGTDIDRSVVYIGMEYPSPIDLSPERSKEGNPEGNKSLDHFVASSPLLFRQRDLFNILVSEMRIIHRGYKTKASS